jgi:hypothetical protein
VLGPLAGKYVAGRRAIEVVQAASPDELRWGGVWLGFPFISGEAYLAATGTRKASTESAVSPASVESFIAQNLRARAGGMGATAT